MVLTWRATTGVVLEELKFSESASWSISKASETEVLVGAEHGILIFVEHRNGKNLEVQRSSVAKIAAPVYNISVYDSTCVAVVGSKSQVWNYEYGRLLHTFSRYNVNRVALSNELIVLGTKDSKMYVHETLDGYNLVRTIVLREFHHYEPDDLRIWDISFLNADIVMATTVNAYIFFVSVKSGHIFSHCWRWAKKTSASSLNLSSKQRKLVFSEVDAQKCSKRRTKYVLK